ncbi:MAG: TrmH family RNA methyltransferase [Armatimonadota bacterium]
MTRIDSPKNQHVKLFRSLLNKKGRNDAGLCPLEGVRLLSGAIRAGAQIEAVYVCEELLSDEEPLQTAQRLENQGIVRHDLTRRAFESITDTENPQGIAATARIEYASLEDIRPEGPSLYLLLHDIRDPGNMGTLVRTAAAFDCRALVILGSCVDLFNPKVIRATAGGVFALPLVEISWDIARQWTTDNDITTVAAALEADVRSDTAAYGKRTALIIGSEAHGLPQEVLTQTDLQVRIPMSADVESLNAGVAAGILLYEIYTQMHPAS